MSVVLIFVFKQKTAYEMRISDWSSDVCSSDLRLFEGLRSQDGAAYSPSVENNWPFSFDNGGYISVTSQLKPDKISYFFAVINRIATDLATKPVSADELQRTLAPTQQLLARASTGNAFWMAQLEGASYDKRRSEEHTAELQSLMRNS